MRVIELNAENLITAIDFTEQDYNAVADRECVSFSEFIVCVICLTENQNGTLEDAVFIANDAYAKLCEKA